MGLHDVRREVWNTASHFARPDLAPSDWVYWGGVLEGLFRASHLTGAMLDGEWWMK
jgi:hypothetical protein